ncbi:hypothetical protein [Streptomyces sp. P17]|nr:hypothetical protein [Streptomyces sp. P17]MDT9698722.1 hypothetical protein [Streptomyces sp. P17]
MRSQPRPGSPEPQPMSRYSSQAASAPGPWAHSSPPTTTATSISQNSSAD